MDQILESQHMTEKYLWIFMKYSNEGDEKIRGFHSFHNTNWNIV